MIEKNIMNKVDEAIKNLDKTIRLAKEVLEKHYELENRLKAIASVRKTVHKELLRQ